MFSPHESRGGMNIPGGGGGPGGAGCEGGGDRSCPGKGTTIGNHQESSSTRGRYEFLADRARRNCSASNSDARARSHPLKAVSKTLSSHESRGEDAYKTGEGTEEAEPQRETAVVQHYCRCRAAARVLSYTFMGQHARDESSGFTNKKTTSVLPSPAAEGTGQLGREGITRRRQNGERIEGPAIQSAIGQTAIFSSTYIWPKQPRHQRSFSGRSPGRQLFGRAAARS